jgi:hypothetical protein
MSWWEPDQMEMARLQYIIMSSWNNETRRKAVWFVYMNFRDL